MWVDIQSSACLAFWKRLGAPNRNHPPRSWRHVPGVRKQSADAWTFSDPYGWGKRGSQRSPTSTIPSDADEPQPLSPAMLLTMKSRRVGPPPGEFVPHDVYARRQWRRVQYLEDQFWSKWRREYLQNMQMRTKLKPPKQNLAAGDVVLVKEEGSLWNDLPMARVSVAIESDDEKSTEGSSGPVSRRQN